MSVQGHEQGAVFHPSTGANSSLVPWVSLAPCSLSLHKVSGAAPTIESLPTMPWLPRQSWLFHLRAVWGMTLPSPPHPTPAAPCPGALSTQRLSTHPCGQRKLPGSRQTPLSEEALGRAPSRWRNAGF